VVKSGGKKPQYDVDIQFRYSVDGRPYVSDTPIFGDLSGCAQNYGMALVRKYPVGKEVKVYYDPSAKGIGVLEPGVTRFTYHTSIMGLAFIGLGVLMYTRKHIPRGG
jgi:hypothetical protein